MGETEVTLILTLRVNEPVKGFPSRYSAFFWVLTDLHTGPPPHLHQLTTVTTYEH